MRSFFNRLLVLSVIAASFGALIGWLLSNAIREDQFLLMGVLTGAAAGVAGSYVGVILRRLRIL
ncbi:hypothetical protein ACFLTS_05410 [Chloroflexota bacterium]